MQYGNEPMSVIAEVYGNSRQIKCPWTSIILTWT